MSSRLCGLHPKSLLTKLPPQRLYNDSSHTEHQGRTHMTILNEAEGDHIFIKSVSQFGFLLSSGIYVLGPCLLLPKNVFHWNVSSPFEVVPSKLGVFQLLHPRPGLLLFIVDVLLLGVVTGSDRSISRTLLRWRDEARINMEILTPESAAAAFNFLNSERRFVACGLIPPDVEGSVVDNVRTMKHIKRNLNIDD